MSIQAILMGQNDRSVQPISLGGTSATTADEGRKNLGAAAVMYLTGEEYGNLPSVDDTTLYVIEDQEPSSIDLTNAGGVLPIIKGGTNATTAEGARINLGLGNVDNTSDADKPISAATQTALTEKADTSLENVDNTTFAQKAVDAGVGGGGGTAEEIDISDTLATSLGLSTDATVADAIAKLLSNINTVDGEAARIEVESYVGTGTYGVNNASKFTFNNAPKYVLILPNVKDSISGYTAVPYRWGNTFALTSTTTDGYLYVNAIDVTISGETMTWYGSNDSGQMNYSGTTYHVFGIE